MRKKLILAALAGTFMTSSVAPALAWRATEATLQRVRTNTANTVTEVRNLRNDVRAQSRILIEALRMQTGEQSGYADKQIEATKRLMDGAQQNETQLVRQEIRAQAESGQFDPNPNVCLLIDLFYGGEGESGSGRAQGSEVVDAVRLNKQEIGSGGAAAAARAMADLEVISEGRDISSTVSTFLNHPTIDLDDQVMGQAAEAYILSVLDPIPLVPVSDEEQASPEGIERLALQRARERRQSAAEEAWAMTLNMADPTMPSEQIQALAADTPYNRHIGDRVSELQALDVRVVSHLSPPPNGPAVSSTVVLQRIHDILSISARMQYMQLEMQRRDLQLQSIIMAKMIENDGRS